MKHRSVVSNYIFKKSQDGSTKVALFRRSHHPDLHTYQGQLAPISGSIDASDVDALAAARRELSEETQLGPTDLRLGFIGQPFTFSDEQAQRSWTVHSFGWTLLAEESRIRLDWEHETWDWYNPEMLVAGGAIHECVPKLEMSLRRVYFGAGGIFGESTAITPTSEAGRRFVAGLKQLRDDKENGARVLATNAVRSLKAVLEVLEGNRKDIKLVAYHLIYSGRPSMNAAIGSAVIEALARIKPFTYRKQEALEMLQDCIKAREAVSIQISKTFTSFIQELMQEAGSSSINILTLSSSSTITSALLHLLSSCPNLQTNVFILESRPACEGASMAATLLERKPLGSKLRIKIAPDSHVAYLAQQLNDRGILLLGADRISPSGHVSNKMGSCAAAVLVKTFAAPAKVVVLSETDKIARPADLKLYEDGEEDSQKEMTEHSPESNDPAEVSGIWNAGDDRLVNRLREAAVENVYFEWVPNSYIDAYVSEIGLLDQKTIRSKSLEKAKLEDQMFEDLYDD